MKSANKDHFFNVVVVGGGFGGVSAALKLSKDPRFNVTLVSDTDSLLYYPLLYATATGASRKISSLPLSRIFNNKPVRVVMDTVLGIDTSRKLVVGKAKQYQYDKVVFALGVVTNYFGIKGLEENSWSIKSEASVEAFRKHLHDELLVTKHFDKHYVIIGGGPTGVELAGSLTDYLLRVGVRHKLKQHNVNITLVEAAPRLLPRMSERSSARALKRLRHLGVHVMLGTAVKALDDDTLVAGNRKITTETAVWTSGVMNHPFFAGHKDVFHLNKRGSVLVNEYLEAAKDIFVIGDNAATKYAGLAQTAIYDGRYVADVIKSQISHQRPRLYFPKKPFSVVPLGHNWALLERGWLKVWGVPAAWIRKLADLIGYSDIVRLDDAIVLWLSERRTEEFGCELCQKNNDSSSVA